MEMDISTLKESGLVREGVWSSILEEYRFVFLRYLEIAKDLIALENEFEYIVALKRFIANGWIFNSQTYNGITCKTCQMLDCAETDYGYGTPNCPTYTDLKTSSSLTPQYITLDSRCK